MTEDEDLDTLDTDNDEINGWTLVGFCLAGIVIYALIWLAFL